MFVQGGTAFFGKLGVRKELDSVPWWTESSLPVSCCGVGMVDGSVMKVNSFQVQLQI